MEDIVADKEKDTFVPKPEALVYIRALFVDENCPEFESKYQKVHHSVDVDFNALDITINQQTWVVLLDFLGIGTAVKSERKTETSAKESTTEACVKTDQLVAGEQREKTTEMRIQMASLSLILNKPEYELAKANVSVVTAHVVLQDGNMDVSGKLGKISLLDLTPHGKLYPERFFTKGEEAVSFDFFKYGRPDLLLKREFDMSVKLRMSSVRYIHTARFQNEVVAFFQQFSQLQDMLGQIRASTAGREVQEGPKNAARIKLDVQAGSPVILAPISSRSKELLVINLGNLTLTNCFLSAGSKGTISKFSSKVSPRGERSLKSESTDSVNKAEPRKNVVYQSPPPGLAGPLLEELPVSPSIRGRGNLDLTGLKVNNGRTEVSQSQSEPDLNKTKSPSDDPLDHVCLLDCINIDLVDMDLFSSHRIEHNDFDPRETTALIFPSFVVVRKGFKLLEQTCMLKLQVERNLASAISRAVPDMSIAGKLSSVHCCVDVPQYQLIRGMLEHNLGEPLEEFQNVPKPENPVNQTVLSGQVWTCICMNIDLTNVTLEICDVIKVEDLHKQKKSIAQFNFNESQFSFESFSNDSITVDLVSHAIRAHDTRHTGTDKTRGPQKNVFRSVHPTKHHSRNLNPLQLELHYNSNAEHMKGTVLLNNMRVICVMDLMLAVKDFLLDYDSQSFRTEATSSKNSEASHSKSTSSTLGPEGGKTNVPVAVGTGIVTKRVIRDDEGEKNQEFRINITETEFVIMENNALFDSAAVILKFTCAVLVYMPQSKENPFFCSLEGLETFSCFMNNEQETALSIIDPATINFQLKGSPSHLNQKKVMRGGLSDVMDGHSILEVHTEALNIRVSYHDTQLFLGIMNSLPEQLKQVSVNAIEKELQSAIERTSPQDKYKQKQLKRLMELGFKLEDCQRALSESNYHLDEAGSWLLIHAQPTVKYTPTHKEEEYDDKKLEIAGVEVRAASFSICLIDDCGDSDVPLLELSLQNLDIFQKLLQNLEGRAYGVLSGDYYNRAISGWEPFIEPWRCNVEWLQQEERKMYPEKLFIQMKVDDCLNINITREMLDLYTNTKNSWTEDYYKSRAKDRVIESPQSPRSQSPFGSWEEVMPNAVCPFSFEGRGKQRHGQTHEVLRISWLSECRVGSNSNRSLSTKWAPTSERFVRRKAKFDIAYNETKPARIVFVVTLEGSARKLITVHSALTVVSPLSEPAELQLMNPDNTANKLTLPLLDPGGSLPIPLQLTIGTYCTTLQLGSEYCTKPLAWRTVDTPGESQTMLMECKFGENFKFCAFIKHQHFPASRNNKKEELQPGHTITLIPPVVLTNLLPVDLTFDHRGAKGEIKPGKDQPLYKADLNHALDISFSFENFTNCVSHLSVPGKFMQDSYARITMKDDQGRRLHLMARIECRAGRCLKICISAFYWFLNLSGQDKKERMRPQQGSQGPRGRPVRGPLSCPTCPKILMCDASVFKSFFGPKRNGGNSCDSKCHGRCNMIVCGRYRDVGRVLEVHFKI
ncbi:putative vacuolar protein sorting-associated protein 13D-like [Apostichopus japonicus]|uniref:Putative vacuolar protein sorting-associated protein 13D-like n=1 Tax=Stichopus japonicus TaxID=307972 RepID=A0A2G8LF26_STIJA|nr:putative vacuolar protein sorting-associated protein 13D-like [Apostichopus japonicus]